MKMKELTKKDIVSLYYGNQLAVTEPSEEWRLQAKQLGLNPEHYIIENSSNSIVNIFELYNLLSLSESDALKEDLEFYQEKLIDDADVSEYVLASQSYDFYGSPKNRPPSYYISKILKSSWKTDKFLELARWLSQGDSVQPINTEDLIYIYIESEKVAISEKDLELINSADISINEWERALVIKELMSLQSDLKKEVPNNDIIVITDKMPRKYMYGQAIIYNKSTNKFFRNNMWITAFKKRSSSK